jgi:polyhydroxybutyrate depolymerase
MGGPPPLPTLAPSHLEDDRQALVVVPDQWDTRSEWPLVIMLHGYGGTAEGHMQWLQLADLANELGFVAVAPDGTPDRAGRRFWDAGDSCCAFDTRVDDMLYLRELVWHAVNQARVDPSRVYILGHSNGGFMGWTLACSAPDLVAGVVSIAGAAPMGSPGDCAEGWTEVGVLQVHGTNDAVVSPAGGVVFNDSARPYPSAYATLEAWAAAEGCERVVSNPPRFDADARIPGTETDAFQWPDCNSPRALWLVEGAEHLPAIAGPGLRRALTYIMQ